MIDIYRYRKDIQFFRAITKRDKASQCSSFVSMFCNWCFGIL